jgi:3-oxoacyl-[acyl-carrier-protein] synthase III
MLHQDFYVAGTGSYHPKSVPVDEAVADGRYDLATQRRTGQERVTVSESETQPEMAVLAGRQAVDRSGLAPDRFALLLHGTTSHNGLDGWNCASYLQHQVLGGHGLSFEIRQLSNTSMGAMELACAYLTADPGRSAALITAADQFAPPVWDRWRAAPLAVYGDGASALVLARGGGFAQLVSLVSASDAELEFMHRGTLPFGPNPEDGHPISLVERTLQSSDFLDFEVAKTRMAAGWHKTITEACDEAGLAVTDADHVVTPHLGRELLYEVCLDQLGIDLDRTTWHYGNQIGHASTDQFAGLNHLAETGRLRAGQRVVMVGVGGGFNWTTAVLEITTDTIPAQGAER